MVNNITLKTEPVLGTFFRFFLFYKLFMYIMIIRLFFKIVILGAEELFVGMKNGHVFKCSSKEF